MSVPKTAWSDKRGKNEDKRGKIEEAEAARERELRSLVERLELEKSGEVRPEKETAHDFVERRMREKLKK